MDIGGGIQRVEEVKWLKDFKLKTVVKNYETTEEN